MSSSRRLAVFLASLTGSLALAASASAAQRVASPTGVSAACSAAAPCDLRTAVEFARTGDEVIVTPGRYSLGSRLELPPAANGLVVRGAPGQPRPRIASSASLAIAVNASQRIQDLDIDHTGDNLGLYLHAGTAERVHVRSSGAAACSPFGTAATGGALIRDSVCWNTRPGLGGWAVAVSAGATAPETFVPRLRNVTAVTISPVEPALLASAGSHVRIEVDARNVIALAPGVDVAARGNGVGGSGSNVTLRTSSFAQREAAGGSSASAPSANGNQAAQPVFVDAAAGDFRQAPGSPTIDAGSSDGDVGALDLDREARVQNGAVDIGADEIAPPPSPPSPPSTPAPPSGGEAPPAADTDPPEVTISKRPFKRSGRRRARFEFAADEAGSTFECAIDGKPIRACGSPKVYRRLASGRHRFWVWATDAAGNTDLTPATYRWRVRR